MRSTKIIKICSSSLCTCLHHMVILRTRNKITDFLMILAWASPFNIEPTSRQLIILLDHFHFLEQFTFSFCLLLTLTNNVFIIYFTFGILADRFSIPWCGCCAQGNGGHFGRNTGPATQCDTRHLRGCRHQRQRL